MSVLRKILEDLEWRSHQDKPMGYVVLTRRDAQQLLLNIGVKLNDQQSYNPPSKIQAIMEDPPPTRKDLEP